MADTASLPDTTNLPRPAAMREVDALDRTRFDAEVRAATRPVVLRGLGRDWPVVRAARESDEAFVAYVRAKAHDRPVNVVVGGPEIAGRFFYTPDLTDLNFRRGQAPLPPFLDRLLRDRDVERPFAMAVQSTPAPELLPGFAEENAIDLVDASIVPRLWLGNASRVAAHFDLMENIAVVAAGRRRFTVFPPEQVGNLYMGPYELTPAGTPVSMVDLAAPELDRFPRFADALAAAQTATLEPGDAIYLPYHWWHAVEALSPINLLVNYWWNPAPPAEAKAFDALLMAIVAVSKLPEDQRGAWRAMFDHLVFHRNGDPAAHLPQHLRGALGGDVSLRR